MVLSGHAKAFGDLRKASIAFGLLRDDGGECGCGCKGNPSIHELEWAGRKHRWPEMRDLHKKTFDSMMDLVTQFEESALQVFSLPRISDVREAFLTGDVPEGGTFQLTAAQEKEYKRRVLALADDVLSRPLVNAAPKKAADDEEYADASSPYPYLMLSAFSISARRTLADAIDSAPDFIDPDKLRSAIQLGTLRNEYLRAVLMQGGTRIKTKLGREYMTEVLRHLRLMAQGGRNPMEVGVWLHKQVGEGASWYWNRITRSESALAINEAFFANAAEFKVPYQEWSASSSACEICAQFDKQIYPLRDGPEPVGDTHPHCMCVLRTVYMTDREIQKPWGRQSPYDVPYTREERQAIIELLRSRER